MSEKPMYLLSYDHGGYILWGPDFAASMKSAIEWMEKYPKFKTGLDNEAYCYDRYAQENPEIIKEIQNTLSRFDGRFSIGSSSYGQPLAVFINDESNVRQITEAVRADLRHFGIRPFVYAISEHAYHSQIPQLILQAGYRMALMRTHFQMYGYNPTYDSAFGIWYGEDGSGIPAIPTYTGQGAHFGSTTMDNYILTRWPRAWDEPIEDFEEKFRHIEPLLASRYDDAVQRCEEMTAHVEKIERYHWVTLEDLFDIYASCADSDDAYRPRANEFKVRMPWGYCGNRIFNDCRKGEVLAAQAERLNALAAQIGFVPEEESISKMWKNLMIAQHHDVQICGLLEEEKEFITTCCANGEKAKKAALDYIASQMRATDNPCVLSVNVSDKAQRELLETKISVKHPHKTLQFSAYCGEEKIPCGYDVTARTSEGIPTAYSIRFQAEVPPMTAKVYEIRSEEPDEQQSDDTATYQNNILLTEYYEIELGNGGIISIKDRHTKKTLLDNPEEGFLFAGIIADQPAYSHGCWFVSCKPMITKSLFQGEIGGIPCRFSLICKAGDSLLYCRATFEHDGEHIGVGRTFDAFRDNTNGFVHEEKLRFIMRVPFEGNIYGWRDRPFLIAPTDDAYIEGINWAAAGNDTLAMAVYNRGSMCLTRESDNILSIPLAYANAYAWGEKLLFGTYTHEFALRPLTGGFHAAQLHSEALAYTYPLISQTMQGKQDGKTQLSLLPIETSHNVRMSACYTEDRKLLLRVYELEGQHGTVQISGYRLTPCDLFGEAAGPAESCGQLSPYQIQTYLLERECYSL